MTLGERASADRGAGLGETWLSLEIALNWYKKCTQTHADAESGCC